MNNSSEFEEVDLLVKKARIAQENLNKKDHNNFLI